MITIFVYGSFTKKRRYNQYYLQENTFLGNGIVKGYKKYILGGVEGMAPEAGGRVAGEVYEINQATLDKLDFFMHVGTSFTRKIVDVEMDDGSVLQAEAHIWNGTAC